VILEIASLVSPSAVFTSVQSDQRTSHLSQRVLAHATRHCSGQAPPPPPPPPPPPLVNLRVRLRVAGVRGWVRVGNRFASVVRWALACQPFLVYNRGGMQLKRSRMKTRRRTATVDGLRAPVFITPVLSWLSSSPPPLRPILTLVDDAASGTLITAASAAAAAARADISAELMTQEKRA
jgi:hypothetical protein